MKAAIVLLVGLLTFFAMPSLAAAPTRVELEIDCGSLAGTGVLLAIVDGKPYTYKFTCGHAA
jgi:hypothetical protein